MSASKRAWRDGRCSPVGALTVCRVVVAGVIERAIDDLAPADRAADLKAGLAVRLREPDVDTLLDTVSIGRATIRLCRSLGFDIWSDADRYLDDDVPPDSS